MYGVWPRDPGPNDLEGKKHLIGIGNLYIEVFEELKRFMEFNIAEGKNESEVQRAVDWIEKAYHADERILEEFISLRKVL